MAFVILAVVKAMVENNQYTTPASSEDPVFRNRYAHTLTQPISLA